MPRRSYGATLLKLVESLQSPVTHRAANEIASSRRTWLRKRIVALVRPDRDIEVGCPVRTRIVGSAVAVGVSLCMGLFSLSGDSLVQAQAAVETSADQSTPSDEVADLVFTGIVLDANNHPVSDALVVSETQRHEQETLYFVAKTDEAGGFSIGAQRKGEFSSQSLWAYKSGHSVRCVRPQKGINQMILPPEEKIRVSLGEDLPADLTVRPHYYKLPNGRYTADESTGLSGFMPPLLVEQLVWRPDENGTVVITGVTRKLLDTVMFESKVLGKQIAPPVENVVLRDTGSIAGKIICPSGQLPDDLTVYLTVDRPLSRYLGTGLRAQVEAYRLGRTVGKARATVDSDGRFEVDALASGKLRIQIAWPAFSKFQPRLVGNPSELVVRAGEELAVQINAEEAVEVRGRIVLDDTGEPVAGVKVNLRVKDNSALSSSQVSTDSDGWYTANMLPGDGTLQCYGLPGGTPDLPGNTRSAYQIPPNSDHFFRSPEDGPLVLKEIRLKPKEVVAGVLLDAAGEPVRDRIIAMTTRRWGFIAGIGKTDDSGRFQWTLDAYKIGLLKAEYERTSSVPRIRRSDSTPRFILLPTDVEDVTDLTQISQAMVDWKELPQARLESDIPLRLRLLSEPTR